MNIVHAVLAALWTSVSMFWQILWPLILGFTISGAVQAVVSKRQMVRLLGDDRRSDSRTGTPASPRSPASRMPLRFASLKTTPCTAAGCARAGEVAAMRPKQAAAVSWADSLRLRIIRMLGGSVQALVERVTRRVPT